MAGLFSTPKSKVTKIEPVKSADASAAVNALNRQRRAGMGTYGSHAVGSRPQGIAFQGLKTALGQ